MSTIGLNYFPDLDLFRKATISLDYQNHSIWYSNLVFQLDCLKFTIIITRE